MYRQSGADDVVVCKMAKNWTKLDHVSWDERCSLHRIGPKSLVHKLNIAASLGEARDERAVEAVSICRGRRYDGHFLSAVVPPFKCLECCFRTFSPVHTGYRQLPVSDTGKRAAGRRPDPPVRPSEHVGHNRKESPHPFFSFAQSKF